jgi:hypothetical protein
MEAALNTNARPRNITAEVNRGIGFSPERRETPNETGFCCKVAFRTLSRARTVGHFISSNRREATAPDYVGLDICQY